MTLADSIPSTAPINADPERRHSALVAGVIYHDTPSGSTGTRDLMLGELSALEAEHPEVVADSFPHAPELASMIRVKEAVGVDFSLRAGLRGIDRAVKYRNQGRADLDRFHGRELDDAESRSHGFRSQ
jgi:hypothetical protein